MATTLQLLQGMTPQQKAAFEAYINAVAPGAAGAPIPPPGLSPWERTQFDIQDRTLRRNYRQGIGDLNFDKREWLRNWGNQRGDWLREFKRDYQQIPSDLAAQGLLTSGFKDRAVSEAQAEKIRALQRFASSRQSAMAGYGRQGSRLWRDREFGLSNLQRMRAARRQQLAQQIQGTK